MGVIANLWVLTLSEAHYSSFSHFFSLSLQIFQNSYTNYKPHHEPTCVSRRPHFLYHLKIRAIRHSSFRLHLYKSTLAFFLPLPVREVPPSSPNYFQFHALDSNLDGLYIYKKIS